MTAAFPLIFVDLSASLPLVALPAVLAMASETSLPVPVSAFWPLRVTSSPSRLLAVATVHPSAWSGVPFTEKGETFSARASKASTKLTEVIGV